MDILERLSKEHKLWLKMLHKIGCPNHLAEDIVQEFYIKVYNKPEYHDKIVNDDSVNTFYIYAILRNMFLSNRRLQKRYVYPEAEFKDVDESLDTDELHLECSYMEYISKRLTSIVEGFSKAERQLYYMHFVKGISQRKIAKKSTLGFTFVNNTCKNIRRVIMAAMYEDMEDLKNKDYKYKL